MTTAQATHPQDISLRAQAEAVASGELSTSALLEATLARIEERDGFNAVAQRFPAEAERMARDAPAGPLRGVPILVKDQFALPWRAPRDGSYKTPYGIAAGESEIFRRLRDAGAVVVGVANMHEFGLGSTGHVSAYGPCRNPWDVTRCSGGSSSGSAAAVAARLVAGAIGTDGGGSIRFPSSYCGLTGLKHTWGQIPAEGFTHGFLTLGAPGPICRDAGDARLLAEVLLSRPLERHAASELRIGIPRAQLWSDVDPEVESACAGAIEQLRDAGMKTRELSLTGLDHALISTVLLLSLEGQPAAKPEVEGEIAPHLSPLTRALTKYQLLTPSIALSKANRVRSQLRRSIAATFEEVDVLAWPSTPAPAPPIEDPKVRLPSGSYPADFANVRLGGVANLAGVPALSVPCGFAAGGLPIGLQLLAPWRGDGRLLDVAALFEQVTERRYVDASPPVAAATAA